MVGFVVNKVTLGCVLLALVLLFPVRFTSPLASNHVYLIANDVRKS